MQRKCKRGGYCGQKGGGGAQGESFNTGVGNEVEGGCRHTQYSCLKLG